MPPIKTVQNWPRVKIHSWVPPRASSPAKAAPTSHPAPYYHYYFIPYLFSQNILSSMYNIGHLRPSSSVQHACQGDPLMSTGNKILLIDDDPSHVKAFELALIASGD